MNDVKQLGKKAFTWSVVALTMLWSLGGVALFSPSAVSAATCPALAAGDLFKVSGNSAVYLLNANLERLYFPHVTVYKSWYPDYSGVHEIDSSCVSAYPAPKMAPFGVNYRAGSTLVKVQIENTVYAVLPGNTLAPIGSEAVAAALYGSMWGKKVVDVADVFWPNFYAKVAALTEAVPHNGMLVKKASDSKVYVVKDGKLMLVDGTVAAAGVNTVSDEVFGKLPMGSGSVTAASVWSNPSQGSSTPTPGPVVTGGNLMVGVAADSSAARIVADGTSYNDILKLALTAGSASVKVTGLSLTKTGLIANAQVTGVSVWDNQGNRHGDVMTSLTSDNKITVTFGSDPILVAAGSTEYLLVKVDLGTSAASNLVGFKVMAATDVKTNGTVAGNFPLESAQLSIVDGSSALAAYTIASTAVGGITDSGSNSPVSNSGNIEIGAIQKEFAKFRFTETSGNEDMVVERAEFYLEGTVQDKDLKNFTVYASDNSVLGKVESSYDRYAVVKFTNPYTIKKSNNRDLTLKADVVDGSGRYVRVHVQNSTDVMVKGASTGYYVAPTSFTDVKETNGWFQMKSGALTVTKSTTSPSGNVSAGSNNVVLAKFDVKAVGENLEVRKMGLKIATSTSGIKYNLTGNVIVRDSVSGDTYLTIAGSDATVYTGAQQNLSSYITLSSGETKTLEVVGSIDSNATSSSNYKVNVGQFYAKRLSTLDFADNLGSSLIDQGGNTMTVNTLSLSFVKDTSMGNKTVAAGSSQVVGQYTLRAGSAEGVKLTNVVVKFSGAFTSPTMIQNLEIWNGATMLGSAISSVATSSNSFSFSLSLAPNESKVLMVKGYLTTSATGSFTTVVDSISYNGTGDSGTATTDGTDVTGQTITLGSANVILSAVTDSDSVSKIYTTSDSPVMLGKWKFEAQNEDVTLKKITFTAKDNTFADDTSAGNFGGFYLYDASNMATPLGEGSYTAGSGNGYVLFTGLNLTVQSGSYKNLVLKGKINASGTLDSDSINAFVVTDDSNSNLEVYSSSGSQLGTSQIDAVSGDNTTNSRFATSTFYKFEDAYPTISAVNVSSLGIGAITPVFKFTVKNEGTRDLRMASVTTTVSVSGMTSNGSATGTIGAWKLYEANSSGGLGTQMAVNTGNGLAGGAGVAGYTNANSIDVLFSSANDVNSLLDSLNVAPGSSRTFIVTADTTNLGAGKGSNTLTVNVSGKIAGSTGWTGSAWNTGFFVYYYTPSQGSEVGPYTASDSYDVLGDTVSRTY